MAQILFLSVLLSALLSFHVALGDSGWVIPSHGMDHVCQLTQDHVAADLCRSLLNLHVGLLLRDFLRARISECALISLKIVFKPKIGTHLLVCASLRLELGLLFYMRLEVTIRADIRIGLHGLFVHGCGVVDAVVKGRSRLVTDVILQLVLEAFVKVVTVPFCNRGRVWCRDLNYLFNFDPHPFPITPDCYGVWRNQPPRITERSIELRSQPVCTCRGMEEEGISVYIDPIISLQIAISPRDHSYYFCHEKDASYIFECMRRGGHFDDVHVSVLLTVGVIVDRLPKLVFSCPRTANLVIRIECSRIYVDMQSGHALLCLRLRVSVGCDLSNFTSSITFTVTGCLNLNFDIDCGRQLLLLSVSVTSLLRIRSGCTDAEGCEDEERALTELFQNQLTAWCVNHINAKIRAGVRLFFLTHYPCESCERTIYSRRCVYSACKLRFHRK